MKALHFVIRHSSFVIFLALAFAAPAADPLLRPHDVIAFVGGEDMVAASEWGYLELLLTRAVPDYDLKFRCLAWEGDTVFEQRRDLNFPPLEAQLDQVGATVVFCQFGQMESLAGKEKLPEFVAAYEKLIERMGAGGKRRILILMPNLFGSNGPRAIGDSAARAREDRVLKEDYAAAVAKIAREKASISATGLIAGGPGELRDDCHFTPQSHYLFAISIQHFLSRIGGLPDDLLEEPRNTQEAGRIGREESDKFKPLRELIRAKNRLWFDYWRVQNWAFLAGDRTVQPSSRDHLDPSKRWFPAEREEFLPLIEAKEQEIWSLARKLAKP
jgi:hypothetical protein